MNERERRAASLEAQRRPDVLAEDDWSALLTSTLGTPVRVRYGRARRTVIRVRREGGSTLLQLADFFAEAPDDVRDALAHWVKHGQRGRRAVRTLDAWVDLRVRELARSAPRAVKLVARGAVHDLDLLADDLCAAELRAAFDTTHPRPALGWGRAAGSRSRRSLRLGSFDPIGPLIRLHPVLDSSAVPPWFVRYVVFHELLHAVLDEPTDASRPRRVHHGPEFRRRERAYADTLRARAWERLHIAALIRCARAGKPFAAAKPRTLAAKGAALVQRLLF